MAIQQLTDEQVRSMSLEEKDRWWLQNVYRGDMPQLTLRSALTGMGLGGALALTNLYIGAHTGWTLGVGLTSVILSFALFKGLAKTGLTGEMTILENNAMQSIATAAGYMTTPLYQSLAAYTMVTGIRLPWLTTIAWVLLLSMLGILFAFPMKKRFINDEQLPFPEGKAAGVLLDALHASEGNEGMRRAKFLGLGAAASGIIELLRSEKLMGMLFGGWKGIPHYWDDFLYRGSEGPRIAGQLMKNLSIRAETSIIFIGTGALMGIGPGLSMMVGGVLNYFVLAPHMISIGVIVPNASGIVTFKEVTMWGLWGGVACMTTASLYSFFAKPEVIINALRSMMGKGNRREDVLGHIELPMKLSFVGIPVLGLGMVAMGYFVFHIQWWLGLIAIPLVFVFSLIAVNSTGITAITPGSALGKLTQVTFGILAPSNMATNLATASITAEVSGNASNLLADIKPGYMLGAKPRQQAIGHLLGAATGLLVVVPLWDIIFVRGDITRYGTEVLPVPSAVVYKGVAELLGKGLEFLHPSARWAVLVGAIVGILMEAFKKVGKRRIAMSGVSFGLAFILPFTYILMMFVGALVGWAVDKRSSQTAEPNGLAATLAENKETICAGIIAGGALTGIAIAILDVL